MFASSQRNQESWKVFTLVDSLCLWRWSSGLATNHVPGDRTSKNPRSLWLVSHDVTSVVMTAKPGLGWCFTLCLVHRSSKSPVGHVWSIFKIACWYFLALTFFVKIAKNSGYAARPSVSLEDVFATCRWKVHGIGTLGQKKKGQYSTDVPCSANIKAKQTSLCDPRLSVSKIVWWLLSSSLYETWTQYQVKDSLSLPS